MLNGTPCPREGPYKDTHGRRYCVLHWQDDGKSDRFQTELNRVFSESDAEFYDLTGVHFPVTFGKFPVDVIDKPIYFTNCVFHGDLEFEQRFERDVYFIGTVFKGKTEFATPTIDQFESLVSFEGAVFHRDVTLHAGFSSGAQFSSAHFVGASEFTFKRSDKSTGANLDMASCTFAKPVVLVVLNMSDADFSECEFQADADFRHSIFLGSTSFFKSRFKGHVDFRDVGFTSKSGSPAGKEKVNFSEATFSEGALFSDTGFDAPTDFKLVSSDKPDRIAFRNVDLSRVSFSGTDISKFEFHMVTWATAGKWWFKRKAVYDEIALNERNSQELRRVSYEPVEQTYRQLQQNYGNSYRYTEAGDFYVGQQEMMRKAKGRVRRFFCLNYFYRISANYGESFWRPFLCLIATLLLFPALFSLLELRRGMPEKPFCDLLVDNLGFMTFSRTGMVEYFPNRLGKSLVILESVIFLTFVTLFLLSLRRRFKRKSF